MLYGHQPLFRSDCRRLVVIELESNFKGIRFRDTHIEVAFSQSQARFEFRINSLKTGIKLQKLHAFLQSVYVDRRPCSTLDARADVGCAEPVVSFHVNLSQAALDDLNYKDVSGEVLVWDSRA